jgi:hypothetical protein
MAKESTTIKISKETKSRLNKIKEYPRESYEDIIKKILYVLNLDRKDPMLGYRALRDIDKAIKRKDKISEVL